MNNETNSASILDKFAEKIDFTKLEGKPEAFYKAGVAFVENGQFDDGIIEFVKIIKTVSRQESLFVDTVKELKSMGFSNADIRAAGGIPETEEELGLELVMEKEDFTIRQAVGIGITAWFLPILLISLFLAIATIVDGLSSTGGVRVDDFQFLLFYLGLTILFFSPAVVFGIVGAIAGRYWRKSRLVAWIGAVIGVIIAIGVWIGMGILPLPVA